MWCGGGDEENLHENPNSTKTKVMFSIQVEGIIFLCALVQVDDDEGSTSNC